MTPDKSSYNIVMPFGKYFGMSLAEIYNINRSYLEWLIITPSIPKIWRDGAEKTLKGESIETLFPSYKSPIPKTRHGIIEYIDKDTLRLYFEYDKALLQQLKFVVDGRKWNNDLKCWEFPAVQINKVVKLFDGIQNIDIDDKSLKILKKETERREDLDEIRVKEDSEEIADELKGVLKLPLYNFQNTAVEFIERAGGRAMVADSMGLGKTCTAIGYAEKNKLKTFIVCPKSTVPGWIREIKRFTGKNTALWTTDGRIGRSDCSYHISNYDIIGKNIKELNKMGFDLLIADEASYLKNRNTLRAKNLLGHYKERRKYPGIKTKYCLFLTGTPILNRSAEAFHLLNFIDNQRFNNFYHFVQRYGGWKGIEPQNLEDLHQRTKDLIIRRLKKDVLPELPDKQRNDLIVEMTPTDQKEYHKHLETLFRKWRQVGKPTVSEMPGIQRFLLEKKLPRAIEFIDELLEADRGVLVFSVFLDPLRALQKHYGDRSATVIGEMNSKERQESIDKLSSGEAKVGLFSIGAGSMGIDGIQKQIDTVIFLCCAWTPSLHEQAEDRVYRIGQNNKVQIFYFICENTIDEYMREILTNKQIVIDTVVDGKLVSIARDTSYFKEFVQKLNKDYYKSLNSVDLDAIEEENT